MITLVKLYGAEVWIYCSRVAAVLSALIVRTCHQEYQSIVIIAILFKILCFLGCYHYYTRSVDYETSAIDGCFPSETGSSASNTMWQSTSTTARHAASRVLGWHQRKDVRKAIRIQYGFCSLSLALILLLDTSELGTPHVLPCMPCAQAASPPLG